jgi:transcriptional regulator with XRE-family HTH domain
METNESALSPAVNLGARLRAVRTLAGLSQDAVGKALGMTARAGHVYVSKLERGKVPKVSFWTVVRYVQACKVPVGRFMVELAQSGAFGEAEQGLTVLEDRSKADEAKRARARLLRDKRWEREAQDADIVAKLWREVQVAIRPLLPNDPTIFLSHYLEGVRAFYRAWKQAVRGVVNRDPTLDVQMAFDRIEQAGLRVLVPDAVHKMREMVFERLMAMIPHCENI